MRRLLMLTGALLIIMIIAAAAPLSGQEKNVYIQVSDENTGLGSLIRAKGVGYPPALASTPAQARLMARRAAIVDGYKNLLPAFNNMSWYISGAAGYEAKSGFIRGVQILDEKTYPDGKVEVELGLPVDLKGKAGVRKAKRSPYGVIYRTYEAAGPVRVITKEEWMEMHSE